MDPEKQKRIIQYLVEKLTKVNREYLVHQYFVRELTDEVASLRQEQGPPSAPAQYQPPAREESIPTVFAYRDGHQLEAQNYAIQGQTLWVFGDQITRKISLADLDLSATKQLNDKRGVEFNVPQ